MEIRPAEPDDLQVILGLVTDVIHETYGHLLPPHYTPSKDTSPWFENWIAVCDGNIAGVGLASGDYVDDLWVRAQYRGIIPLTHVSICPI